MKTKQVYSLPEIWEEEMKTAGIICQSGGTEDFSDGQTTEWFE